MYDDDPEENSNGIQVKNYFNFSQYYFACSLTYG